MRLGTGRCGLRRRAGIVRAGPGNADSYSHQNACLLPRSVSPHRHILVRRTDDPPSSRTGLRSHSGVASKMAGGIGSPGDSRFNRSDLARDREGQRHAPRFAPRFIPRRRSMADLGHASDALIPNTAVAEGAVLVTNEKRLWESRTITRRRGADVGSVPQLPACSSRRWLT